MNARLFRMVALGLVLLVTVGCGGSGSTADVEVNENVLNPVRGVITLNGKDIPTGSTVTFHPKDGSKDQQISGTYNAEESYFSVMTVKDGQKFGGAPEGIYTVTVQPPKRKPGSIPTKFANPATSGIEVEVKQGEAVIPEIKLAP